MVESSIVPAKEARFFDDYAQKNTGKRIQFAYRQSKEIPIFPWEVGYFVNRINTIYYKYELLNSISGAVSSGVDPKNIVMLNKSLPLNDIYADFDVLDLNASGLSHIYFIGTPISLIPNIKTEQLSLLLSLFKSVNKFMYGAHIRPAETTNLKDLWQATLERGFSFAIKQIDSTVGRHIKKIKPENQEKFSSLIKRYVSLGKKLKEDFQKIEKALPKMIHEESIPEARNKLPKGLYNKFFLSFFRQFDKMSRPLIGAAYYDQNKIRILGRALVNKKLVNHTTLELIETRRHSPLSGVFVGGAAVISAIRDDKRAEERHSLEMEILQYQRNTARDEAKKAELELMQKRLELCLQLEDIGKRSDVLTYEQIKPGLVRSMINAAYLTTTQRKNELLEKSGMELDENSIRVIDIKV